MRTLRSRMCRSGHQKATLGAVLLVAAVVGSSCGGGSTADETSKQATNPTTGAVKTGSATPSSYSTTVFAAPFDIAVPDWLEPGPSEEHPNFVTWNERAAGRAVRFLIPVDVFAPGTADAGPVPDDFVGYLMAQRDHGAKFSDEATTTVDGRPATIVTATVDQSLDGSLGCPEANMSASDCFGLQPEFVLRIAVIDTGAAPLLVWLRDDVDPAPDLAADRDAFDQVLANIHFSDRTPRAPAASSASAIDGTYQWTITEADALAHGTANDRTPENLATLPWTFTIAMRNGKWTLTNSDNTGPHDEGSGTYTVSDGSVTFNWRGNSLSFDIADEHGSLQLTPRPPMDPGDQYVWATKDWERVDAGTDTGGSATPLPVADSAPVGVIAIGHSGLTGENSDPAHPGQDAKQNSWATGTSAEVDSIYERLIAVRPETVGHVANTSRGGAAAETLASQAKAALATVPRPALVVIQVVDNDIRCDGTDPDHIADFGAAVNDALTAITTASPDTQILIVGQTGRPDPSYVEALVSAYPDIKDELTGTGACDFYDTSGNIVTDHFDQLSSIIDAYEAEQARVCSAVPHCMTLNRSGYVEILDDYSNDFNHLNTHGLARAAEMAWPAVETLLGLPTEP